MLLERVNDSAGALHGWYYWCPGCDIGHIVPNDGRWQKSGTDEAPTFTPSLLIHKDDAHCRCHLFITAGQLVYCADSHHALAGKTVPMVPVPREGDVT